MAQRRYDDEEDTFLDDGDEADQDEQLADAGFFVEDEDGFEESKKNLDLDDEEEYGLEPSGADLEAEAGLLDEYPDEEEDFEEDGDHAEEDR